jgi:hypothetical protein
MLKPITVLCVLMFTALVGLTQSYESTTDYDKKKQAAFAIDYDYPEEAVENAIIKKMEKLGYNGKEEKGLFNKDKGTRVYRNTSIPDISTKSLDYIVKVDRKSRKESDKSTLYLIVLKDGQNARSNLDVSEAGQVQSFLNDLLPEVEAANLELQIKSQEDVVVKAEKKLKGLRSDKEDMESKIRKLQDDIKKNIQDQEAAQKDIEAQKKGLEDLKGKRKS